MISAPLLSIVIPTLGRPILIQTLQSLLASEGAATLEILVVGVVPDASVHSRLEALLAENRQIRHLSLSFHKGDSSEKKNAGMRESRADIVAFIDDDVVVAPGWPARIVEPFADPMVGLVSGPSLVPDDLPRMARLAGVTLASKAAGYVAERYKKGHPEPRAVKWSRLIGCNMAYRRNVIREIGGFDPAFWPGEEMIAAFLATQKGHKLIFHPDAWLYHYPRSSFHGYVKQIYGYGATRIRLMRAGVDFEPATVLPAVWVLSLVVLAIGALFCRVCVWLLVMNLVLYLFAALFITAQQVMETRRASDALMFVLVPVTHLAYGIAEWVEIFRPGKDLSCRG